jgi:hypothetical protein
MYRGGTVLSSLFLSNSSSQWHFCIFFAGGGPVREFSREGGGSGAGGGDTGRCRLGGGVLAGCSVCTLIEWVEGFPWFYRLFCCHWRRRVGMGRVGGLLVIDGTGNRYKINFLIFVVALSRKTSVKTHGCTPLVEGDGVGKCCQLGAGGLFQDTIAPFSDTSPGGRSMREGVRRG